MVLLLLWAGELGRCLREHQEDPGRYGWHQRLITFEVGHSAAHPQGPSPTALSADGRGHQQHGEGPGAAAKPLLLHQVRRAAGLAAAGAKAWHGGGRASPRTRLHLTDIPASETEAGEIAGMSHGRTSKGLEQIPEVQMLFKQSKAG